MIRSLKRAYEVLSKAPAEERGSVTARMWAYRGITVPLNVFDAKGSYPLESAVVLAKFQELYDIEDQAKALSPEGRLELRQSAAAAVWADLMDWLDSESATRALPKSPLGKGLA